MRPNQQIADVHVRCLTRALKIEQRAPILYGVGNRDARPIPSVAAIVGLIGIARIVVVKAMGQRNLLPGGNTRCRAIPPTAHRAPRGNTPIPDRGERTPSRPRRWPGPAAQATLSSLRCIARKPRRLPSISKSGVVKYIRSNAALGLLFRAFQAGAAIPSAKKRSSLSRTGPVDPSKPGLVSCWKVTQRHITLYWLDRDVIGRAFFLSRRFY